MKSPNQWLCVAATLAFLGAVGAQADTSFGTLQQVKTVFVIAMENHNFTQPSSVSSPEPILGNAAAPYLNSLVTPGNSNALQVSYATRYFNSGVGVHPSEPNYVWQEAASDFGYHNDTDPTAGVNIYTVQHFTAQLNAAGIPWKNYQENVSLSTGPQHSVSGTSTTVINPYYHTGQYNYGAKHDPMVFFTDTAAQNVYELSALFTDLANNTVGRYNWITPNQFDDAHSALSGAFTYAGKSWTGDQEAIATGDNFLATVVPQIMASQAYRSNGVIVIWFDETEGGDTTNFSLPEIIISPLAKGNAYASTLEYSHSSDLKTMEEIFGLGTVSNAIPASETNVKGVGYNFVSSVNDLSDMFAGGAIGTPAILPGGSASMTFYGSPGESYSIIASDDLAAPRGQWNVIGEGTFDSNTVPFIDADAINHTNRFYGLILK